MQKLPLMKFIHVHLGFATDHFEVLVGVFHDPPGNASDRYTTIYIYIYIYIYLNIYIYIYIYIYIIQFIYIVEHVNLY